MPSPVLRCESRQGQLAPVPLKSSGSSLSHIVSYVAALERGEPGARTVPLQTFAILETEYAQLDECLEDVDLYGFYHDKVRNDYDPSLEQLVLRIPTNRHKIFVQRFIELILAKITKLADILKQDYPIISQRLLKLRSMSTSDIDLLSDNGKVGHKSPDVSIGYSDCTYPQAVFEVAYNQDRRALKRLAWDYIMGSSHCIRCVVGLNPDYLRDNSPSSPSIAYNVSVSVWRPLVEVEENIENMDVKQDTKDQRLGEHYPDHEVAALFIRDLLEDEMLQGTPANIAERKIIVTSREMVETLASAECHHNSTRRNGEKLLQVSQDQSYNWRKRRITPDEELGKGSEVKHRISQSTVGH